MQVRKQLFFYKQTRFAELSVHDIAQAKVDDNRAGRIVVVFENIHFLQTFSFVYRRVNWRKRYVVQFRPLFRQNQLLNYKIVLGLNT